mmetsp:Transcript_4680/g.3190  ORF Transcript_4680/g.3190 Transcript_4680/m.3190 type:complete len:87 (+) Transcript_4680:1344-1604(+)
MYFKRPDGKPRNPCSYIPFASGKRICIGKTFSELIARYVIPMILYHFDLEYADPKDLKESKPNLNALLTDSPKFMMRLNNKREVAK